MATNKYGFDKIVKITPETIMEPDFSYEDEAGNIVVVEKPCLEVVWIEVDGAIYSVETEHGETLEGLASLYKVGGYTDSRCTFVQSI